MLLECENTIVMKSGTMMLLTRANTGHAVLRSASISPKMKRRNGPTERRSDGVTERRSDGRTDGRMDGRTDGQTDPFTELRLARTQLKIFFGLSGLFPLAGKGY